MRTATIALPGGVVKELRLPGHGSNTVSLTVRLSTDLRRKGSNIVLLDPASAKVVAVERASAAPLSAKFVELANAIHKTELGGLPCSLRGLCWVWRPHCYLSPASESGGNEGVRGDCPRGAAVVFTGSRVISARTSDASVIATNLDRKEGHFQPRFSRDVCEVNHTDQNMLVVIHLDPTCPICAALLQEASESVCAHLRAIAALELAVRENWVEMIPTMESSLATARELSDDNVWRYRAHVASMHTGRRRQP